MYMVPYISLIYITVSSVVLPVKFSLLILGYFIGVLAH